MYQTLPLTIKKKKDEKKHHDIVAVSSLPLLCENWSHTLVLVGLMAGRQSDKILVD